MSVPISLLPHWAPSLEFDVSNLMELMHIRDETVCKGQIYLQAGKEDLEETLAAEATLFCLLRELNLWPN